MIILWLFVIVSLLLIVIGCYALLVVASDADDREELMHEQHNQKMSAPGNGEHDGLLGDDYTGGVCEQPDRVDSEE